MKLIFKICVLGILVGGLSVSAMSQDILPVLVQQIKPSAVAIETFDREGKSVSRGSGFFIGNNRIVTNRHVIERSYRVEIQLNDGSKHPANGILAIDNEGDIAILSVRVPRNKSRALPIVATNPKEGESIVVIGNPYGLEGSVSNGIVSAVREVPGYGKIIQITAPISPGSSGSPVVNMRGEVIGVATLQASEGQSLNFAVPSARIGRLKVGDMRAFASAAKENNANKRVVAERLYSNGLKFLSADEFAKALTYFEQAVKSDPKYAEAWYQVGFCYGVLGQHERSLEASQKAAVLRPEWPETWTNIGSSNFALEEFDAAAKAFKEAIKLDETNGELQYSLGLTYNRLGRTTEEILAYRRAVRIKPDHTDALEMLGSAYLEQGRWKRAISTFKSIQNYKIDGKTYFLIGLAFAKSGSYRKSIDPLTNAVNMDGSNAEARYRLAISYLKLKDRNQAQIQYEILRANGSEWADRLLAELEN